MWHWFVQTNRIVTAILILATMDVESYLRGTAFAVQLFAVQWPPKGRRVEAVRFHCELGERLTLDEMDPWGERLTLDINLFTNNFSGLVLKC